MKNNKGGRPRKKYEELIDPSKRDESNIKKTVRFIKETLQFKENEVNGFITKMVEKLNVNISSEQSSFSINIAHNIERLYNLLPTNSPLKYPIIQILSNNIPNSEFIHLTNLPKNAVYNCKDVSLDPLNIKTHCNHTGGNKDVYSEGDIEFLIKWIKLKCPVPSGSKYEKFVYLCTIKELYQKYCEEAETKNYPRFQRTKFEEILKTINIRQGSYDFTSKCEICSLSSEEMSETDWQKVHLHFERKMTQEDTFETVKHNLSTSQLLIVQDFTSHSIPYGKCKMLCVNILILTVFERNLDGKIQWKFYNYVSTSEDKQTYDFVDSAWTDFIKIIQSKSVEKVYLFSDGGPKHFRVVSQLF